MLDRMLAAIAPDFASRSTMHSSRRIASRRPSGNVFR